MDYGQLIEQNAKINFSQHDGITCYKSHSGKKHIRWLIDKVRINFNKNSDLYIDDNIKSLLNNGKGAFRAFQKIHKSNTHNEQLCKICNDFKDYELELDILEAAIFGPKTGKNA